METYLVVAETLSGETVTANFNLTVKTCQNRYGLVTMRFFTDNIRMDNWWKLYAGREAPEHLFSRCRRSLSRTRCITWTCVCSEAFTRSKLEAVKADGKLTLATR